MAPFDRKEYQRQYSREWAKKNPDRKKALARSSYEKRKQDPDWARKQESAHLMKRYGITIEQKEAMWESQKGLCAVCGNELTKKNVNVDHCHSRGKVRGLLCHRCNMVLAAFETTPHRVAMETYIANPPAYSVIG